MTGRLAGAAAGDYDLDGGVTSDPLAGDHAAGDRHADAHASLLPGARLERVVGRLPAGERRAQRRHHGAAHRRPARRRTATGRGRSPTVNLTAYAGQTVRIVVEAADASTASLVEAAVDDVRITRSG